MTKQYDKSIKSRKDKELYSFLTSGANRDIKKECKKLKEEGFNKKNIVDIFRKCHLKGIKILIG